MQSHYPDFSEDSPDAVNLIFGLEPGLPRMSCRYYHAVVVRTEVNPAFQVGGVRRICGNICRVAGRSPVRVRMPQ